MFAVPTFCLAFPDGFIRYQVLGYRLDNSDNGVMVPELDLDANLQLTATLGIHALAGGRSQRACEILEEAGYSDLPNVVGGFVRK